MTWWQAAILGVVEGLTEYLPVSSTGHLILTQRLLGIARGEAANTFVICIQGGAIAAVLGLYRHRAGQMARGLLGRDADGLRLLVNLLAAFVPAAAVGLLLEDPIDRYLLGLWPVVAAWFLGGVLLLTLSGRARRARGASDFGSGLGLEQLTWRMAVVIGLAQCAALWPGVSRSLATIAGGLLVGLHRRSAVEFSFLLGVLTLGAAAAYKAMRHGRVLLDAYPASTLLIGFAFAVAAAVLAVRWMVAYLGRHDLAIFGWYRVVLALAVAGLLLAFPGWLAE